MLTARMEASAARYDPCIHVNFNIIYAPETWPSYICRAESAKSTIYLLAPPCTLHSEGSKGSIRITIEHAHPLLSAHGAQVHTVFARSDAAATKSFTPVCLR